MSFTPSAGTFGWGTSTFPFPLHPHVHPSTHIPPVSVATTVLGWGLFAVPLTAGKWVDWLTTSHQSGGHGGWRHEEGGFKDIVIPICWSYRAIWSMATNQPTALTFAISVWFLQKLAFEKHRPNQRVAICIHLQRECLMLQRVKACSQPGTWRTPWLVRGTRLKHKVTDRVSVKASGPWFTLCSSRMPCSGLAAFRPKCSRKCSSASSYSSRHILTSAFTSALFTVINYVFLF